MSRPRRFGIDLAPLRVSASYRRLYLYGAVGGLSAQATYFTVLYQLKNLTHSTLGVGALGLVELVPMIVFGLYGGVIADHFNRRRVVIVAEAGMLITMIALLVNARLAHPSVVVVYVVAAALAACSGAQSPSLAAMTQQLVPHNLQRESSTLQMIARTGGSILGPAVGGLVAVASGPWVIYFVNVLTFAVTLVLLFGLRVEHVTIDSEGPSLNSLRTGARYAASRPDVLGTYVVDLIAMVFAFPVALLPFVADGFHSHYAFAVLSCGLPVGALLATLTSSWTASVHHYGRLVVISAVLWGLGIVLFGWAHSLTLAFIGLVIGGGADAVSGIFRMTLWNESIPLRVRGRMAGIEMLSYTVGPNAGQIRAGAMASVMGNRGALVVGGLVSLGGCAAVPLAMRSLWRFDARTDRHVAEVALERANESFA